MTEITCSVCKVVKLKEAFSPSFMRAGYRRCRLCEAARVKAYRDNRRNSQISVGPLETVHCLVNRKKKLVSSGIEVRLTAEDVMGRLLRTGNRCELTDIEFNWTNKHHDNVRNGHARWNSISIDRIEPSQGYTPENVRIVLHSLNSMMGSWGLDQAVVVSKAILNKVKPVRIRTDTAQYSLYHSLRKIKLRSKSPVTLTLENLMSKLEFSQGCCELTGLPMTWPLQAKDPLKTGKAHWNSISVDRVRSQDGYTPENTRLILYCVNTAKGVDDDPTLRTVATALVERWG